MTGPLLTLIVATPTAFMISLCIAGLRDQLAWQRKAREQAEADAKREKRNARRRYLYALRHLPRYKVSVETVKRGDLL